MNVDLMPANALEIPALFGSEGEFVLARVSVEPRHLEELVGSIGRLGFSGEP